MAIAGKIEYQITVDSKGLKQGLNDSSKDIQKWTKSVGAYATAGAQLLAGAMVTGSVTAVTAIAQITKASVKSYAEFEQLSGGIEAMFGGMEKGFKEIEAVNKYASNAWQDLTMSENEYFRNFSSTYPLMKASIADQNQAIEATNRLLTLNSDLANTFGYSIETASNAVNWALKGSFNYLDNLNIGIKGTKEGFLEAARNAGYMVDSVDELSSLDILDILEKTASQYGVLGRTAEEASQTISGSLNMVKSSWTNLITEISKPDANLDVAFENLIKSAEAFGKNLLPVVKRAINGAVQIISRLAPEIVRMIPSLFQELLPAVIEGMTTLVVALIQNLPTILQTLMDAIPMLVEAVYTIVNSMMQVLPYIISAVLQIVLAIVSALVEPHNLQLLLQAGIELLYSLIDAIPQIIIALANALPDIISSIIAFLTDPNTILKLVEASVILFGALVSAIPLILTSLLQAFTKLFADLWAKLTTLFSEFASNFGERIAGVFKRAINAVLKFIEDFINAPINMINGFIDTINSAFGSVGVNIGKIGNISLPRMATGGIVPSTMGGRLIVAGEGGEDEWVVPESKMASMVDQLTERGVGGGVTINVYGTFATSDQEQRHVAEQIYDKLQEINKARMGVYL